MKKKTIDRITTGIICGMICGMIGTSSFLLVKTVADAKQTEPDRNETIYVIQTDEQSHPYAVLTDPRIMEPAEPAFNLTAEDRETVAQLVAGQAGDKCTTAQIMIAQVMYNQMLTTGGRIAGTEYARCPRKTPTEATYEAVDAIFTRGEFLLDDTVLWTGNAESPDAWHRTLRLVTTCDGIAFYEVP